MIKAAQARNKLEELVREAFGREMPGFKILAITKNGDTWKVVAQGQYAGTHIFKIKVGNTVSIDA